MEGYSVQSRLPYAILQVVLHRDDYKYANALVMMKLIRRSPTEE